MDKNDKSRRVSSRKEGDHRGIAPTSRSWSMFLSALPLLSLWLALPTIFLLIVFGVRAGESVIRPAQFPAATQSLTLTYTHTQKLTRTVDVSYPEVISTDPALIPQQTVSFQVSPQTIPSDESFMIAVDSSGGLALENEEGHPLPLPARWRLLTDTLTSAHFQLRPAPRSRSRTISLTFQIIGEQHKYTGEPITLTVEPSLQTWFFRMIKSENGTAAVVISLLTALLGFGIQQWNMMIEEKAKEKLQKREGALAEIGKLQSLLEEKQFDSALGRYQELRKRIQTPWQDETIQSELEAMWREAAPRELQNWLSLRDLTDKDKIASIILWAYKHLQSRSGEVAQTLAEFITTDTIYSVEKVLTQDTHGITLLRNSALTPILKDLSKSSDNKAAQACAKRILDKILRTTEQISLWSEERALSPPATMRGVQALELSDNPFGPEWAERDPLLKSYGIRPASFWEWLKGPHPVLALGAAGSGKTATAFLLAHDCGYPPANPNIAGVFPVYHVIGFDGAVKTEAHSPFDPLARTLTESLLQSIAQNPYRFSDQQAQSKAAMAYLMLWYLGAGTFNNLKLHLRRAGLESVSAGVAVIKEMETLVSDTSICAPPDEMTLMDLLGWARPVECQRTYLLMDFGIAPNDERIEEVSAALRSILERANHLARSKTYLKVFWPQRLMKKLGTHIPVETVELLWTKKYLQEMLETRLTTIGIPSLSSIYSDPAMEGPDPDERLIETAQLSPRRLIQLGNEMLARVEKPPLRPEHLP